MSKSKNSKSEAELRELRRAQPPREWCFECSEEKRPPRKLTEKEKRRRRLDQKNASIKRKRAERKLINSRKPKTGDVPVYDVNACIQRDPLYALIDLEEEDEIWIDENEDSTNNTSETNASSNTEESPDAGTEGTTEDSANDEPQLKKPPGFGLFRKAKYTLPQDISIKDLGHTPYVSRLFSSQNHVVVNWLLDQHLISPEFTCPEEGCGGVCYVNHRKRFMDHYAFRCQKNRAHEWTIRSNSFFGHFRVPFADVFCFFNDYLLEKKAFLCARNININESKTCPIWTAIARRVIMQRIYDEYFGVNFQISGLIQADESAFGSKLKYDRGKEKGQTIWVLALVERSTGRFLLFPIDDR